MTNSEGGADEGASVHSCIVAPLGTVVCAPVEATARLGEAGDVLIGPDGAAYFMLADTNTGNPKVHRLSVKRNALSELPVRNQSILVFFPCIIFPYESSSRIRSHTMFPYDNDITLFPYKLLPNMSAG